MLITPLVSCPGSLGRGKRSSNNCMRMRQPYQESRFLSKAAVLLCKQLETNVHPIHLRPCKGNFRFLVPAHTYFYISCGPLILSNTVMGQGRHTYRLFFAYKRGENIALWHEQVISNIKINRPPCVLHKIL